MVAPGLAISNLRGLEAAAANEPLQLGLGTIGFVAFDNRVRTRRVAMLVSSRHVLFAHGARTGDAVYQPIVTRDGELHRVQPGEPVAHLGDDGCEDDHVFAYPGELPGTYFVDAAAAPLVAHVRASSPVRAVARLHPLDVLAGRSAPRVRWLSRAGALEARVIDAAASIEHLGRLRHGNLVIRCAAGQTIAQGDSGALLVDDADRAVGLVWGRAERDATLGFACHIHPVLDRLQLTLLTQGLV